MNNSNANYNATMKNIKNSFESKELNEEQKKLMRKIALMKLNNQWFNDELINFYMEIIERRSEKLSILPSWFTSSTNSSNWTRSKNVARDFNQSKINYILIPYHVEGNHWTLAVISRSGNFYLLDSLAMQLDEPKELRQWIDSNLVLPDKKNWVYSCPFSVGSEIRGKQVAAKAHQRDNFSCGVFVGFYAKLLSQKKNLKEIDGEAKRIQLSRIRKEILEEMGNNIECYVPTLNGRTLEEENHHSLSESPDKFDSQIRTNDLENLLFEKLIPEEPSSNVNQIASFALPEDDEGIDLWQFSGI
eukprot:TRINITY_DN3202_c0_g1_i1.p1 TRINITY_DN3202_c0_g1~~TRINITY_DN3202_c0_g1_i1.p1  ORF type:complete len:302 (-),score=113.29 TRINITY_DN3202_c0_g1_i1:37-942(-)